MTQVRLLNVGAWQRALAGVVAEMDAASKRVVTKAAHEVEREAKKTLSTSSHRKNEPTPSRPGQPPSLVTGTLRRSIKVTVANSGTAGWSAKVGPTAVYGRIQELGGWARRSHLPARPYMAPTMRKLVGNGTLLHIAREEWAAALHGRR